MSKFTTRLAIVITTFLAGCTKDDPLPLEIASGNMVVCRLLTMFSEIPSLPDHDYSVSFVYDGLGRVDTARVAYVETHFDVAFHYATDHQADSVTVSFTYPPNMVGSGYRIYFGYDNQRRQISWTNSAGYGSYYSYNAQGQLSWKAMDYGLPNMDTVRYFYPNDTTHNYHKAISKLPNGQMGETTFIYDNHPIPQKFPLGVPFELGYFSATDNNLLKETSSCCGAQYSYTYNAAGYPSTQTIMPGSFGTKTFTYRCDTLPN
jgi:hypothetical protein